MGSINDLLGKAPRRASVVRLFLSQLLLFRFVPFVRCVSLSVSPFSCSETLASTDFFLAFLGFPSNCPESLEPFIRNLLIPILHSFSFFLSYLCSSNKTPIIHLITLS
ncbi:MAG: hypothetical protein RR331_10580, partial [Bacteroides sp.]